MRSSMSTITEEWITVAEASKLIGVSMRRVRQLVHENKIKDKEITKRFSLVFRPDVETEASRQSKTGRPRGG